VVELPIRIAPTIITTAGLAIARSLISGWQFSPPRRSEGWTAITSQHDNQPDLLHEGADTR